MPYPSLNAGALALAVALAIAVPPVLAQESGNGASASTASAATDTTTTPPAGTAPATLPTVVVSDSSPRAPVRLQGGNMATVNAVTLQDTINVMNTEDSLKYLPDLLVRKRFIGDTQAPLATRTTGINASARTLIFADGIPLSTLINNNNGNGSPQWFLVPPGAIDHVNVYYGPYSAAYAGNSYGAVVDITTRLPEKFEARADVMGSEQKFHLYGTDNHYGAGELNLGVGDRMGRFHWHVGYEHLDSASQPLTYETIAQSTTAATASQPVITGAYADYNRTGGAIQVLGAGTFTHTVQDSANFRLTYDFTDMLRGAYTLGYWHNNAEVTPSTFLQGATGAGYYGATSGTVNIGGYSYNASSIGGLYSSSLVEQSHLAQALTLQSHSNGAFDWSAIASSFNYLRDLTRSSTAVFTDGQAQGAGRTNDMGATGWTTLDLKGIWRPQGMDGANLVSFGGHDDRYKLVSPVFNTSNWYDGAPVSEYSDSHGRTETYALWVQDQWRLAPHWTATLGNRYEHWRGYNGYNLSTSSSGTFAVSQPVVEKTGNSPKAALAWQATHDWLLKASLGRALRFPTVGELYQNVQTGTTYTQANPFLKPEDVASGELMAEYDHAAGFVRATVFDENVQNALISQTSMITGYALPVSFVQNVDRTRQLGAELVAQQRNVFLRGFDLSGNLTYVDARILENSSYVPSSSTPDASSVGKQTPYVARWRATLVSTYRPDERWAFTVAGRYSTRLYATVDNTDIYTHTYTGFDGFFVVDLRAHYQLTRQWGAALGIDNVNNDRYFLYHPFPQRTAYAQMHYDF